MATIFRGPTYAQQQRRPPTTGSGWIDTPRLLTTLVLLSAVPFKTPTPQVTPQHPNHQLSANFDTSQEVPKVLYTDANKAFFVPPHFSPNAQSKRGFLNFDASEGTPKTLYSDSVTPFFIPPHKAPDRRWPVTDTTYDTPLTILAGGFVQPPLVTYQHTSLGQQRLVVDTSRGVVPTFLLSGITGSLATTNANDTLSASGTSTVTGSLATTNANDTSAGAGTSTVTGSLARTNADDTSAASGSSTVTGSLAYTNADDTLSAAGGSINGTVAYTNADDTLSAFGAVGSDQGGGGGPAHGKRKRKKALYEDGLLDASQTREDAREAIVAKRYPEQTEPTPKDEDDDDLAFILSL